MRRVALVAPDGVRLASAVQEADRATVSVVVVPGTAETVCEWLPRVNAAVEGLPARVVVLGRRGTGASEGTLDPARDPADVVTAARWAAGPQRRPVVLVGADDGALAALVAAAPEGPRSGVEPVSPSAPRLAPAPCGLFALSPRTEDVSPAGTVSALVQTPVPGTLWVTWETTDPASDRAAGQVLARARRTPDVFVRELPLETGEHGGRLLDSDPVVRALLRTAVRECLDARRPASTRRVEAGERTRPRPSDGASPSFSSG
jgi:hypothetical protein